ncbi:MAG: hypothetical protein KIT11_02080 [Fimbriimonadaceae bacterium]|nr:hypothetical protein [Fimbriimonadaceae bacterium]QYK54841.1 MAG: hypothetical protein KF733_07455 [Fimbriimonadaceae bacterium]
MVTTFGVMTLLAVAAASYVESSSATIRQSRHAQRDLQTTHLCEAGVMSVQRVLWRPFRLSQKFTEISEACAGASLGDEKAVQSGEIASVGRFVAGVVDYQQATPYLAVVTIRAVGYLDTNKNGQLDENEPFKEVRAVTRYELARSKVFDYTYFINNYGWMDGFRETDLIVNGDMRANGNFDFLNGSPTVNGSVYAAANERLDPPASGFINTPPVKWTDNTYSNARNNNGTAFRERWRPVYSSGSHGSPGEAKFEKYRDMVFKSQAAMLSSYEVNGAMVAPGAFGAVVADARGTSAWNRTSTNSDITKTVLDSKPTNEIAMPDLSDISRYQELSQKFSTEPGTYQKPTYADGTANPNYGQPAYVEVWNSSTNAYQRLSNSNGRIAGSAVLVGTSDRPIKIYGPVTVDQDVVIKGFVQGQGTLYTGRNVHVVGSVRYKNGPNFLGDPEAADLANEKRDMLGLAARGSVIMGDSTRFQNPYPLYYMMPPFTKGRYDENNNYIPPYNAMDRDSTGRMKYQSVVSDETIRNLTEGVNQVDAIMYTNFVGGGNVGMSGGGFALNGTIVSKDEAIVGWSLPIRMNYDNRIRERGPDQPPLIDLNLPRQPTTLRSTWQDRGFHDGRES